MPLPVAHCLAGASIVAATRSGFSLRRDWGAILLGATLALIPDLDLILAFWLKYGAKAHGGFTHSILFALLLGIMAALAMRETSARGMAAYSAAALSHGLLDVIPRKDYGGAQLLWPFSDQNLRLGIFRDYEFYPDPNSQSVVQILSDASVYLGYETLVWLPIFIAIIALKSRPGAPGRVPAKPRTEKRQWT